MLSNDDGYSTNRPNAAWQSRRHRQCRRRSGHSKLFKEVTSLPSIRNDRCRNVYDHFFSSFFFIIVSARSFLSRRSHCDDRTAKSTTICARDGLPGRDLLFRDLKRGIFFFFISTRLRVGVQIIASIYYDSEFNKTTLVAERKEGRRVRDLEAEKPPAAGVRVQRANFRVAADGRDGHETREKKTPTVGFGLGRL